MIRCTGFGKDQGRDEKAARPRPGDAIRFKLERVGDPLPDVAALKS